MVSSYGELLRDPRWQRKRLEILHRDYFMCRKCGTKEKTLHVHHVAYFKGQEPWEYSDDFFLTLCWECHGEESGSEQKGVIAALSELGFFQEDFYLLMCFIKKNPDIFKEILKSFQ